MKEDKYSKNLAKNQVCAIFHILYGVAMFMSLSGAQIWLLETNRNICFWVFLLMRQSFT